MPIQVRVVRNDFAKIAGELRPKVTKAVRATALEISAEAKQRAPVLTGNLRRSIYTRHRSETASRVGVGAEYGPHVEYGTTRMAPRPYLTPAVEAARHRFAQRVAKVFE